MLFNRDNNGSDELRYLTGSYYANNDFNKIEYDLCIATDDVARVVGKQVIEKATMLYAKYENLDLVQKIQRPIALLGMLRFMQKNDLSHEDTGRKMKISENDEKIPWEWQIEKDDRLQLEEYYRSMDRLIDYMTETKEESWINSEQHKQTEKLLIRNAIQFDQYFPINSSSRMFVLLSPFIKEVERRFIKPALGNDYDRLRMQTNLSEKDKELLEYVIAPIPLLTMSIAIRRLPLSVVPCGVIQNYISSSQSMNAGEVPSIEIIREVSSWLYDDAMVLIEEMKHERNGNTERILLPKNEAKNKYCIIH